MSKMDGRSRSLLEYVPDIDYVEPEVVSEKPDSLHDEHVNPNFGLAKAKSIQKLADNIEKIAEKVQDDADDLATGFCVELQKSTDYEAVMAMRRHFPETNPFKICYEQYKECKEEMRELANGVTDKVMGNLSEENIQKEASALRNAFPTSGTGDIEPVLDILEPNKTNRPEDDKTTQIVEPLDMEEFQDSMLRHLANLLWKKFVKPVIPLPPGVSFLPDEIAPLPKGSPTPEQMTGQE